MQKKVRRLHLNRETLRLLNENALRQVAGLSPVQTNCGQICSLTIACSNCNTCVTCPPEVTC
jgi:hypothetical protein